MEAEVGDLLDSAGLQNPIRTFGAAGLYLAKTQTNGRDSRS